ncbi:hypothetical protein [Candidatus Magnetaquicoccus inordinatus]|uniref:hypothetical protein n=1 Tax=Candidatus Magnetaquicoccus inordinatus TaxID=2496818 RepID=UPI00102C7EAD|nr:hypothetical protein [Candidatus Magnetaquicoccus inordinatus]
MKELLEHEERDVNALVATQTEVDLQQRWQPERKLWIAVLSTAINDALFAEDPLTKQTARRWFQQGGKSFALVCELANFEPEFVRKKILQTIEKNECQPSHIAPRRGRGRPPTRIKAAKALAVCQSVTKHKSVCHGV